MTEAIGIVLLAFIALLLLPVTVLLVQVVFALKARIPDPTAACARPRLAILVPAHNESTGIRMTLESLLPQLVAGDRLVVVADNCSDNTAGIAFAFGAEVAERHDMQLRGKGYALDFGIRYLENDPPSVVLIVDADCVTSAGSVEKLACLSAMTGRPVQALDLMKSPKSAGAMMQIAEFAWVVKNLVRPLGYLRLGLPCQLMGTGMAIPWSLIRSLPLAGSHLVEDLKMGIDCARIGRPPLFCPAAQVVSQFPVRKSDSRSQRTRWEHGHLAMILGQAPRLIVEAIWNRRAGMLALVIDMCVPPVALLTLSVLAAFALAVFFGVASGNVLPLQASAAVLAGLVLAVLLAWMRFGREVVSLGRLACAPLYVMGKLPLYLRFLLKRQVEWVRSKRDES